ncbi:MAG: hypothetical protein CMQ45_06350 [Gammaproteobacteria bacterium]|nr:hypothetical protein [Gammaproteobacteria bacterium]
MSSAIDLSGATNFPCYPATAHRNPIERKRRISSNKKRSMVLSSRTSCKTSLEANGGSCVGSFLWLASVNFLFKSIIQVKRDGPVLAESLSYPPYPATWL